MVETIKNVKKVLDGIEVSPLNETIVEGSGPTGGVIAIAPVAPGVTFVEGGSDASADTATSSSASAGGVVDWLKSRWMWVVGAVVVVWFLFVRKGNKGKYKSKKRKSYGKRW